MNTAVTNPDARPVSHHSFAARLIFSFGALLVLAIVIAVVAWSVVRSIRSGLGSVVNDYADDLRDMTVLERSAARADSSSLAFVLTGDEESRTEVVDAERQFQQTIDSLAVRERDPEGDQLLASLSTQFKRFEGFSGQLILHRRTGATLDALSSELRDDGPAYDLALHRSLDAYVAFKARTVSEARARELALATTNMKRLRWIEIVSFAAFLIGGVVLARRLNEQYARTEREAELRGAIVGVVAHDLKGPLTTMQLNLEAQERYLAKHDSFPPELRSFGERLRRSTRAMQQLIFDLLDLGKLEAGRLTLERASLAVASLVEESVDGLREIAALKDVHLEVDVEGAQPVACDRARVLQVLNNLLGNAIKFSPRGGTVTARARTVGSVVQFAIVDHGKGMSSETLEHLFVRYWQERSTSAQGTGLGLTIAKGIVDAHGGRIWATSKLGEGSTFWFELPTA